MEENGLIGNVAVSEVTRKILEKDPNNKFGFKFHTSFQTKVYDKPINSYLIID